MIPEVLKEDIQIKRRDKNTIIQLEEGSLLTKKLEEEVPGYVYFEPASPYNKVVVVERHGKNGNIATGILKGFNLEGGAIGSTIAHDSHNMILVGDNDDDILLAAKTLEHFQGGYVLIKDHEVKCIIPCPIAGLMSTQNASVVTKLLTDLKEEAQKMGVPKAIDPFQALSFLALPVIPEIRILDGGVYDVVNEKFIEQ